MELKVFGTDSSEHVSDVESLKLSGEEGEMTILANHMTLYASLRDGIVKAATTSGQLKSFLVTQAVAIIDGKCVTICADLIESISSGEICNLKHKVELCKNALEKSMYPARWKKRLEAYQSFKL
jgi:F0F1-type ATP synthase epsilon subunit